MTYSVVNASNWSMDQLAPFMSDILQEMGRLAKRFPKDCTTAAMFQEVLSGRKTLWMVMKDGEFVAMALTSIRTVDATGTRIMTLCDLAGRDVAKFADELTTAMEAWAETNSCDVIAVEGRAGWQKFLTPRGYREHARLFRKSR